MDSWSFLGFNPTYIEKLFFVLHKIFNSNLFFFAKETKEKLFYAVKTL